MLENAGSLNIFVVLSIGLLFGLKHATEVDHVVAVSTIVSRHRNVFRSAIVGALWGAGHTAALMIIGLGAVALWRSLRKRDDVHVHEHSHDGVSHIHLHFHEPGTRHHAARV